MKRVQSLPKPARRVFGSTTISFVSHLFGTLTCTTCWAIFGPSLALLFGSGGIAFLAALRPYAPMALAISAVGICYSAFQLAASRESWNKVPFKLAAVFTLLSAIGWTGSAAYTIVTLSKG